jgi:hypothetical protein
VESDKHTRLKERATKWLRSTGCTDIRYEVRIASVPQGQEQPILYPVIIRLDVVGFKESNPTMGIECGVIHNALSLYAGLRIPVRWLPFENLNDANADDGDDGNLSGCIPLGLEAYARITKRVRIKRPEFTRGEIERSFRSLNGR